MKIGNFVESIEERETFLELAPYCTHTKKNTFFLFLSLFFYIKRNYFNFNKDIIISCSQGNDESCLSILNNFYNDGIKWHDVACHHVKPFVCEDSDELLNFVASRNPGIRLWKATPWRTRASRLSSCVKEKCAKEVKTRRYFTSAPCIFVAHLFIIYTLTDIFLYNDRDRSAAQFTVNGTIDSSK